MLGLELFSDQMSTEDCQRWRKIVSMSAVMPLHPAHRRHMQMIRKFDIVINNNNNNNITSMALESSEARAQKRNKTKSVIIFMSRGHTGIIISFKGAPTI